MLAPSLSKFGPLAVSRKRKRKLTALLHHIIIDADPDPVIEPHCGLTADGAEIERNSALPWIGCAAILPTTTTTGMRRK
jgi:hypothetical protein